MSLTLSFSSFRLSAPALFAVLVVTFLSSSASAIDVCRLPAGNVFVKNAAGPSADLDLVSSSRAAGPNVSILAGSLQFSAASYSISETGVTATILVTRTDSLSGAVTVDYATSNGTASSGQDYAATAGTLSWADGDGEPKSITIGITDDLTTEGDETVNIKLENAVGAVIGSPGEAVLSIVDNEESFTLSVDDVTQPEGNGANTLIFTISLSAPAQQPVTVRYFTADGTASASSDYSGIQDALVTFNPGETQKLVGININGDTALETDEFFILTLTDPTNALIGDGEGIGTLTNDDAGPTPTPTPTPEPTPTPTPEPTPTPTPTPTPEPTPTPTPTPVPTPTPGGGTDAVQFSSTAFSVHEGVGNAVITVTRTGSGSAAASVNYAASNGTATAGQDYTAVSGTLTWDAGDTSVKTFNVPIIEDSSLESAETVNLVLSGPTNVTLGSPNAATLTILDNDGIPDLTINDVTQAEGNTLNQMVFTVSLSNAFGQQVSVNYATDNGTATGGSDYVAIPNSLLVFNPGETSKQISVNILGDFEVEPDENFLVNLTGAINANIVDSQGVGSLINDDTPGTIQFSSATYTVSESDGNAVVTITRSGGLSQGVSVRFVTVDGTAHQGADYVSVRTAVVFEPGQASKTVNIPINNDSVDEPDETINIALESPTGGAVLGSPINGVITITDDDTPPVLSVSNVTQSEGNTGTTAFTFTVTLTGQSSQAVTVNYSTADGSATASDYTAIQGMLTFDPGQTTKQVTVQVTGDYNTEPNETFFLNLGSPVGATIGTGQGIGTINNDDLGGAFRFTSSAYSVGEGSGSITITVQRTGGLANGATVQYSTSNGTAIAGQDYTAVSGTLTFAGGQTSLSFVVPINNDGIVEADEVFSVILSNATGTGSTLGTPNTAMVFISDTVPEPEEGPTLFDYDDDGRADLSVRRPSDNTWYLLRETAGYTAQTFGIPGDLLAPADYDGDGITDVAVFRGSNGSWYVFMSATQTFDIFVWGVDGDLPVPMDRDADGKADLVVFRPSNSTWYTRFMGNGGNTSDVFGETGDKPVRGDFDGDGRGDLAVFRPSDNNWYIRRSTLGYFVQTWGATGDIPTPADFDGDGKTDIAVFRPATGQWFRVLSASGFDSVTWGQNGDKLVAADYDGDGKADVAVYRPENSTWYIVGSATGIRIQQFGVPGDVPDPIRVHLLTVFTEPLVGLHGSCLRNRARFFSRTTAGEYETSDPQKSFTNPGRFSIVSSMLCGIMKLEIS